MPVSPIMCVVNANHPAHSTLPRSPSSVLFRSTTPHHPTLRHPTLRHHAIRLVYQGRLGLSSIGSLSRHFRLTSPVRNVSITGDTSDEDAAVVVSSGDVIDMPSSTSTSCSRWSWSASESKTSETGGARRTRRGIWLPRSGWDWTHGRVTTLNVGFHGS